MAIITKINPFSLARFQAFLGALLGFVAGVLYAFGGLVVDLLVTLDWVVSSETPGLSYGTVLAFGALLGMPLIGTMMGLIMGFVAAVFYNLFAKFFGGLEIDFL